MIFFFVLFSLRERKRQRQSTITILSTFRSVIVCGSETSRDRALERRNTESRDTIMVSSCKGALTKKADSK